MAEEKILIPAYKRTGNCARCGADIYSADLKRESGWPLMSACGCEHGPQLAADSRRGREAKPEEERAQAA